MDVNPDHGRIDGTPLPALSAIGRISRTLRWLLVAVILVLLVSVILARRAPAPSAAPEARRMTVAVYPIHRRDLTRSLALTAELRPWNEVNVYAKVAGYLKEISVDYGSRVSAGQTMAVLDLPEQEADLQRADAAYRLAKADYDRLLAVVHTMPGLVAQADVDKARATYEMTKDQRDLAASVLGYRTIAAPFSGVVTKRYVDPGALIQQGISSSTQAEPIVRVADIYKLRLTIEAPESIVPALTVGMPADVKIQATGETISAQIARFSYDVHPDSRTMLAEIDIPNPDLRLKPGMYASVTLGLEKRRNVLALPTQALSTIGAPSVWVVDGRGALRERPISVGLRTPDWIEVTGGLHAGDKVVFGDRSVFVPGMVVQQKPAVLASE